MNSGVSATHAALPNLYGSSRAALRELVERLGAPAFHGDQIHSWLYARDTLDPRLKV